MGIRRADEKAHGKFKALEKGIKSRKAREDPGRALGPELPF